MIGLKRHTVRVVEHDPAWGAVFAAEHRRLHEAAGDLWLATHHVGSTAVPGLPAKPIIDILAITTTLDVIPALTARLGGIGYIYRGDAGSDGGHLFVKESEPDVRTIHLHVVADGDSQIADCLAFRDTLARDAAALRRYSQIKRSLADQFPNNRKAYAEGKREFIQATLAAMEERPTQSGDATGLPTRDGLDVRPYQAADEVTIVSLWEQCGLTRPWNDPHRDIQRKLAVQADLFLVAVLDGQIVGSVMAGYEGHRGWINYLAVAPAHRGRGFGRRLMHDAESRLAKLGCPKINLQVRSGNRAVIEFYRRIGYAQDDVLSFGKRIPSDEVKKG